MTVPVVRFRVAGVDTALEMPQIGEPGRPFTVIYDGNCNVCKKLVGVLDKWDRGARLEVLPSQAPGVGARFPWITERAFAESVQVVRASDGKTWQGAAAIERLLDVLPRGKWISWVFGIPFVRVLAEKFYRWFARNRYHMGCGQHCQLRAQDFDWGDSP